MTPVCSRLHVLVQALSCVLVAHSDVPEDEHWLTYLQHLAEVRWLAAG